MKLYPSYFIIESTNLPATLEYIVKDDENKNITTKAVLELNNDDKNLKLTKNKLSINKGFLEGKFSVTASFNGEESTSFVVVRKRG